MFSAVCQRHVNNNRRCYSKESKGARRGPRSGRGGPRLPWPIPDRVASSPVAPAPAKGQGVPRALVVGASVGGLFSAALLQYQGWKVKVWDKRLPLTATDSAQPTATATGDPMAPPSAAARGPEPTPVLPNGVILTTGRYALEALGVGIGDLAQAAGAVPLRSERRLQGSSASLLDSWEYGEAFGKAGLPESVRPVAVSKAKLLRLLESKLDPGTIEWGRDITQVADLGSHLTVATQGQAPEALQFDLAIAADGHHSVIRSNLLVGESLEAQASTPPRWAGRVVWSGLAPFPTDSPIFSQHTSTFFEHYLPGGHFVAFPVDNGASMAFTFVHRSNSYISSVWDQSQADRSLLERMLRSVSSPEDVINLANSSYEGSLGLSGLDLASNWTHPVADGRWSDLRVALLGSAAHPMLNNEATAVNQAMEDSIVLAATVGPLRPSDPPAEFSTRLAQEYAAVRIPFINSIRREYETSLEVKTAESRVLAWLRRVPGLRARAFAIAGAHQASLVRHHYHHLQKYIVPTI